MGGLEEIIKEVKPKLIISSLRGPYEALIETHHFLINLIDKDPFLRNELASIDYRSNSYFIGLRSYGFEVEIGQIRRIGEKLSKLKVFCAYLDINLLSRNYSLINLKFKNQVVGS